MGSSKTARFVLHKHHASHLHYDLRLQLGRVLKSWAVPKGAPKKLGEKHLAILVEDHPLSYANFEGEIPEGHYGAGKVKIWDHGRYRMASNHSLPQSLRKGVIEFELLGEKLSGRFALVHFKEKQWLWMKLRKKSS